MEVQQGMMTSQTDDMGYYRYMSDAACKEFLSDKLILACILKGCTEEFKDCDVHDIETKYIEGDPEVGTVGVHPETTNEQKPTTDRIHGINTESTSDTEGMIVFDIRFYAMTPTRERVKLIINIEAQNRFNPGYPLIKRGIYYGCRQVSAQYGSEFTHAHYGEIKKVYSIWICFNPPKALRNTMRMYHITEKHLIGDIKENAENYDLMSVVMICLGTQKDERYTGLLKLLDVFMSEVSDFNTKSIVLKSEFGAMMPERLQQKELKMCNYSDFIYEKGVTDGEVKGEAKGKAEGKAEALIHLMKNLKLTFEQALVGLSIPETEWDDYRKRVESIQAQAT